MNGKMLVIGGDIRGVQTALDLADCGMKVTLVEQLPLLGAKSQRQNDRGEVDLLRLMPRFLRAASHPNINILTNTSVLKAEGGKGDFRVTVMQQPRYINVDICTSCARCEHECPVNVIPPSGETGNGRKAIHRPDYGLKSVPSAYSIDKKGVSPCTAACPAGINVQGYVSLIVKGKFAEALELITEAVPFPRVLGRVCTHPCETACTRGQIDQPVAICALKRFTSTASYSLKGNQAPAITGRPRVAIIGAGPAGLTAAYDLARLGHRATIFEALPVPGGMITVGMPRFRLPREVRQADIADIVRFGIEIKTSTPVGKELTLDALKHQGYEAILIAVGAHKNQKLGIPGEGLSGVMDSIAFLRALNLKQPITVGHKVAVIGGGYTAIDSARTAVRLHCEQVIILYRRGLEEMPANPEEVTEAQEEGVQIEFLVAPVRIVGHEGKVIGVECIRMKLGEPDRSGRRRPIPIEGSEFLVKVDTVIVAVGQRPDLSFLGGDTTLTEGKRHIVVAPVTMATKVPGIFAAGDAAGESGPMIDAIAAGRRAAISIDRFLRHELLADEHPPEKIVPVTVNVAEIYVPPIERQPMPCLEYEQRVGNFEEVDLGFTAEMAIKEAKRCLNCAVCSGCRECERVCELKAVDHNATPKQIELEASAVVVSEDTETRRNLQLWDIEGSDFTKCPGIYLIPLSPDGELSSASAVASRVMADLTTPYQPQREYDLTTAERDIRGTSGSSVKSREALCNLEPRIGIIVCGCGGSISEVVDVPDVLAHCQRLADVVLSHRVEYACTGGTAREIKDLACQHNLTHIVLAACSCCNLGQICFSCSDRRVQCKSNLLGNNRQDNIHYEFINIREHCAWVHRSQAKEATAKAKSLIKAGIAQARMSQPLIAQKLDIERGVLVIGNGLSGMQAVVDLAAQGFPTVLVRGYELDKESSESHSVRQRLQREVAGSRTEIISRMELINIEGTAGNYRVTIARNGKSQCIAIGAVVVDMNARLNGRKSGISMEEVKLPPLIINALQDSNRPAMGYYTTEPMLSRLPTVFFCGVGQAATNISEALVQGSAAASKVSVLLNKGTIEAAPTVVSVDQQRCRGCGTCESVCRAAAITVTERIPGVFTARVDERQCLGCGMCLAQCPTGALTQNSCSDLQVTASLEAMLS